MIRISTMPVLLDILFVSLDLGYFTKPHHYYMSPWRSPQIQLRLSTQAPQVRFNCVSRYLTLNGFARTLVRRMVERFNCVSEYGSILLRIIFFSQESFAWREMVRFICVAGRGSGFSCMTRKVKLKEPFRLLPFLSSKCSQPRWSWWGWRGKPRVRA